MVQKYYIIDKEYTDTPGPRSIDLGEFSGEDFRETVLKKLYDQMKIKKEQFIYIDLDGVYGYGESFLDEAFGGFVERYSRDNKNIFCFKSIEEPELIEKIQEMIENHLNDK